MNIPELLAPAGSAEALKAALSAGADAVYIGGDRFGARAYADNPDADALLSAIELTHRLGKKIYLTVNTLLKDAELSELTTWLRPYYTAGIDAVIVQDFGVLSLIREEMPDLPVHASTQMAVTGSFGASLLQKAGVSRVIAARELSLSEIRSIREKTGMDIEVFVHGALCYSVSGLCLMSSMIGGRSGNRGRCAGICRLPFRTGGLSGSDPAAEEYPLNMKDLCAIDLLPQLVDAGVTSLKIEGRMKRPEYTAGVTAIYRHALDRIREGDRDHFVTENEKKELLALFNRDGFTDGYFHRRNGEHMVALENEKLLGNRAKAANEIQVRVRETLRQKEREHVLQCPVRGHLQVSAENGAHLTIEANIGLPNRDPLVVDVSDPSVEKARTRALEEELIRRQLDKTGGSPFFFEKLSIDIDEAVFAPMQVFRELRRTAFVEMEEKMAAAYHRDRMPQVAEFQSEGDDAKTASSNGMNGYRSGVAGQSGKTHNDGPRIHVEVSSETQVDLVLENSSVTRVYVPVTLKECLATIGAHGKEAWLALPMMLSESETCLLRELEKESEDCRPDGFLLRNLEELGWYLNCRNDRFPNAMADLHLYTMNHLAIDWLAATGCPARTLPVELPFRSLLQQDTDQAELIVYGRTPMMVTRQCLKKTYGACDHKETWLYMTDRKNMTFPVRCLCEPCGNVIYNSVVTDLTAETEDIRELAPASLRVVLTTEGPDEIREVLRRAEGLMTGHIGKATPLPDTTRGHFRRGVE